MRDQSINSAALAWILGVRIGRAFALRHFWAGWYLSEVTTLIDVTAPVSRTVPIWGQLVKVAR